MKHPLLAKWRASFVAGLLVILPTAVSIMVAIWILKNITSITDTLLIFLPREWTHKDGGDGPLYWYYSLLALLLAVLLITGIGHLTKNYIGRKLLEMGDRFMMRVPLINKIYSTIKQVNEAFSGQRASFKQVVLLEYPRQGVYSLGFITNDQPEISTPNSGPLQSVFVPTTPNPTSGFIVLVPASSLHHIPMPVQDAIKFVISLGSLAPEAQQESLGSLKTLEKSQ
ncbi:DUF502 domain-containing protein [Fontisphaera persica]|uniref:DUF502 domain-containing protein n=1 Tax=Fontisphaera persica TaxID=2974023 RepID=UPI0024BFE3B4|nr:DUF502 domain-containing protein [Fontisphaera persica]WCJ59524.1 DUF502 domain-containing protein [Fontisphaera persica]